MKVPIIGLHGCYCHPFSSWEECEKAHGQEFTIGDPVKNRHTGTIGSIHEIIEVNKGFFTVKYGDLPKDLHLEHAAQLIKL